jgi:glycosyltransferase involved in cell wall biosynthesis
MNVTVSVVITSHNYAHFLPNAVASVVAQTFPNWELIIVDDGSTDATVSTAHELMLSYPDRRMRLLWQPDQGPAAARNTGARHASGTFVLFLDADDMLAPTMLERATAVMAEQPDVGFVYSGMQLFGHDDYCWPGVAFDRHVLALNNIIPTPTLLRYSAWQQVGGFDRAIPHFEDWEFWMRVVAAGWRGYHINAPLVYYRRHAQSMSVSSRSITYEWHTRAQIIRKHPAIYGSRLVAWATVHCARHNLALAYTSPTIDTEVREIPPPSTQASHTALPFAAPLHGVAKVSFRRRLIRAVPFGLRFRVKCWWRRAQFGLRAALPWLYL